MVALSKVAGAKLERRQVFSIPVYPHVKKFILKKFRLHEPARAEEYNTFGKFIMNTLQDNRLRVDYNDSQFRDRLTASLQVNLTINQAKHAPRLQKLIRINHAMDDAFKEHLVTWIQGQNAAGIPAHTACKIFLEYYDIDENEYSLDAAYKIWQRSKESLKGR
jgi:hypothetical protein